MNRPTDEQWQAVTRGAMLSVGGGLAMVGVRSLGLILRAVFGGEAYGIFVIAYNLVELLTYFLLGGFVDAIVLFAARYLPETGEAKEKMDRAFDTSDGDASTHPVPEHVAAIAPAAIARDEVTSAAHATDLPVADELLSPDERHNRLYLALGTAIGVPLLMSIAVAALVWVLAPLLHETIWSDHDPLIVTMVQRLSWTLPLLVLMQLPSEAIKSRLQWGWSVGIVQVGFPSISLAGALVSELVFHRGIMGLVDGVLVAFAVCVPLSLFAFSRVFSLPSFMRAVLSLKLDRSVVVFAVPQGLNMALNQGLIRVDALVLSAFISANAVGVYALVAEMTQLVRLAKMSLSSVYSPLAARLHAAMQRDALLNALRRMATMTSLLSIPLLLVIMSIYPSLVLDADEVWEWPAIYPWLLVVGPMMSCFFGLAGNTLLMVGRPKLLLMNSTISGSLNIVLNLILVPVAGVLGAAIGTAISNFTISFLQIIELAKLEKLRFHLRIYLRTLIAAALPVGLVMWLGEPTGLVLHGLTGLDVDIWLRGGFAAAMVALFALTYALGPGPSALAVWRGTRELVEVA
jgi:O-antigen/teichoic acid export membrane protein